MAPAADSLIGAQVAVYRLEALIGRGGAGRVYRARHLRGGWPAALKLLDRDLSADEQYRERFLDEARLARRIEHPSIVPIHDVGEANGRLYIVMPYVAGGDLSDLLRHGPIPPRRAVAILGQVASALDAAHARGLVHRDVKPGNILLGPADRAYLADFGIAQRSGEQSIREGGFFHGTLGYAAPEQINGEPADARTDVYGLACVLYQCLAGVPPYRGTDEQVIEGHRGGRPPALRGRRPELPPGLEAVVGRGLARAPRERHRSCRGLIDAARAATDTAAMSEADEHETKVMPSRDSSTPVRFRQPPPPPSPPPPPRRRWRSIAAALLVLLLIGGAGAVAVIITDQDVDDRPPEGEPPPGGSQPLPTEPGPGGEPEAPPLSESESLLLEAIPAEIRPTCGPGDPSPHAAEAALECSIERADTLTYYGFSSAEAMDVAYAAEVARSGAPPGDCSRDSFAHSEWQGGRVLCFLADDRSSWIEWTDEGSAVFGVIGRDDRRDDLLYRAWLQA